MRFSYITRNILYLSIISLFTDIASELLYPIIPLYLSSIGIGIMGIGMIEGAAETISAISKTYFGILSDRLQKRKIFVVIGYSLSALSKPLMILFPNYFYILFLRVTDRLGKGIRTAPRDALLSDESTALNKGRVFGFHRSMDTLGAAIGPVIALVLIYIYQWQYEKLFLLSFIPGIIAIIIAFLIKEKQSGHSNTISKQRIKIKDMFAYWIKSNTQYKIITVLLISFYLFNSSDMLLLLKAKTNGIQDIHLIILYIIYNMSYTILAFPMGIIGDKLGLKNIVAFGLLLFGIVYAGVSYFNHWKELVILFVLYGGYSAAIEGNIKALISNLARRAEVATAIGFFTTLQSLTFFISNTLTGWLWNNFSPSLPFVISGAVAIVVGIIMFLMPIKYENL